MVKGIETDDKKYKHKKGNIEKEMCEDMNVWKHDMYMSQYKSASMQELLLLKADLDNSGDLSNQEKYK